MIIPLLIASLDSNGECARPVAERFVVPGNGNGVFWYRCLIISQSTDPLLRRYSFDYGNVHVIQFSSEHNWLPGSEQYLSVVIWSLLNIGLIVTTGGSKLISRLSTAQ